MSDVTGLQNITNKTLTTGEFKNTEHGGNNRTLPDYPVTAVGNAWVPWVDSGSDLVNKHFVLETGTGTKYVFQHGSSLWSADTADEAGWNTKTAIFAQVGLSVNLTIEEDGSLTIEAA